jgi:hypothetical protein
MYPGLEVCLSFVSGRRGRWYVLNSVWILVQAVALLQRMCRERCNKDFAAVLYYYLFGLAADTWVVSQCYASLVIL